MYKSEINTTNYNVFTKVCKKVGNNYNNVTHYFFFNKKSSSLLFRKF